jgi:hypothetical protein
LGSWAGMWHIYALATVIKHPILSIYPQFHSRWRPAYNKLVLPRDISQPVCTAQDCKQIAVFWTRLSPPRDLDVAKWAPNHFFPCVHTKHYQSSGTFSTSSAIKLPASLSKPRPKKQLSLPTLLKQPDPGNHVNRTCSNTTTATRGWTMVKGRHSNRRPQNKAELTPNPRESRTINYFEVCIQW